MGTGACNRITQNKRTLNNIKSFFLSQILEAVSSPWLRQLTSLAAPMWDVCQGVGQWLGSHSSCSQVAGSTHLLKKPLPYRDRSWELQTQLPGGPIDSHGYGHI